MPQPPNNQTRPRNDTWQPRQATLDEILDLRLRVLRPGLPRETAMFDGDDHPGTEHYGCFADGQAIGCLTLMPSRWNDEPAWQLRGMAVDAAWRGRGVGRDLLTYVDTTLQRRPAVAKILWCNAREAAANFYRQNGWRIMSEQFEIEGVGPHYRMARHLQPAR